MILSSIATYRSSIIRLAALLMTIFTITSARSETHYKAHITVGAHGGMTMAKADFNPSVPQSWATGFCGGVSLRYAEEKLVGILGELNIVQRGWKEDFEESPLSYTRTATYLTLPILTHVNFGSKRCRVFFNLGPEFSYMISESTSANFDYTHPTEAPGWPERSRMTEQLTTPVKHKFDYGITAGLGVEFWATPRNSFYLEGRFYFGLGNMFPSSKADTFGASRLMNLAFTLGYNFRLK